MSEQAITGEILQDGSAPHPVLETAQLFVDRGFDRLDSVFTPGRPVWDEATVGELHHLFVENLDLGAGTFMSKLEGQIGDGSDAAKQLAAELLVLNFLPLVDLTPETKRDRIATVLSWMTTPAAVPAEIEAVYPSASFNGGVGFKVQVWSYLAYLISALRRWHALGPAGRGDALADPWAWKEFVFDAPGKSALAQRNALLYLVHPRAFLPIVSQPQKTKIRNAFREYLEDTTDDVDRDLLQITLALQAEAHGPISYYFGQLRERWAPTGKEPSPSRRAWLVRGSSVEGYNLVPTWLAEGWVSLAARLLREVDQGIDRHELKAVIEADYEQKSYAARETKVQEFDAFLNKMKSGDLVVTTSAGKVYLGTIEGPPEFVDSDGGRSNLRREPSGGTPSTRSSWTPCPRRCRRGSRARSTWSTSPTRSTCSTTCWSPLRLPLPCACIFRTPRSSSRATY